jgi:cell division septal protein FtsQ
VKCHQIKLGGNQLIRVSNLPPQSNMRKHSSKNRIHRHHVKVLKSEVMSPRIAWFNFLDFLKLLTKIAVFIGILGAIGYGVREAIHYTFHQNPDFRLQAIQLNTNDVIDETQLVEQLGIDLNSNIFDFDIDEMERKLLEIPAIQTATIERELPGTLVFHLETRQPQAWIACSEEGLITTRNTDQFLVDQNGYIYPCPEQQLELAVNLPIIQVKADPKHPIALGVTLKHPEFRRCSHLLDSFRTIFPNDIRIIETIYQPNLWSINLSTRTGTTATFGLDDHSRQLEYFTQALSHAQKKGYGIETINLIPKQNVPITIGAKTTPPRAIPVEETPATNKEESRQNNDLQSLLNRN